MTQDVDTSPEAVERRAREAETYARAIRETQPGEVCVSAEWFDANAATLRALVAERDGYKRIAYSAQTTRDHATSERDRLAAENEKLRAAITAGKARLNRGIATFHLSPSSAPGVALVVAGKTRFANEDDVLALLDETRAALTGDTP